MVRASLFATAVTATLYGRRCNKAVSHGHVGSSLDRITTARAPCISNVRRQASPRLLMPSSAFLAYVAGVENQPEHDEDPDARLAPSTASKTYRPCGRLQGYRANKQSGLLGRWTLLIAIVVVLGGVFTQLL
jgi:hypothetical protein